MPSLYSTKPSTTLPVLRWALALVMFPHGAQKLLGWFGGSGFSGTIAFFETSMGILPAFTILAILTEFFAPIFLALGLFTRVSALALTVNVVVAMFLVNFQNGFFWTDQGYEFPLLIAILSLFLVLRGAGSFSLDQRLSTRTR